MEGTVSQMKRRSEEEEMRHVAKMARRRMKENRRAAWQMQKMSDLDAFTEVKDSMPPARFPIAVGEKFVTFAGVEQAVKKLEQDCLIPLTKGELWPLQRNPSNQFAMAFSDVNHALVYSDLKFVCDFWSKCDLGGHEMSKSKREHCKAGFQLTLSKDATYLEVVAIKHEHNHKVSKEIFERLFKDKKIKGTCSRKANDADGSVAMSLEMIDQTHVREEEVTKLIQFLSRFEESTMEVYRSEGHFTGLFFQKREMKLSYHDFPEMLFLDEFYLPAWLNLSLILLNCLDSMGHVEVIAVFLLVAENKEVFPSMMECFKRNNKISWERTRLVLADEHFFGMSTLEKTFCHVTITQCLVHTLRAFHQDVTCQKLAISGSERDLLLEVLTNLLFSKSEEEYKKNRQMLDAVKIPAVVQFLSGYHQKKESWVEYYKSFAFCVGEKPNRKLFDLGQRVEELCSQHTTLVALFEVLGTLLSEWQRERDGKTFVELLQKTPVDVLREFEREYASLVTPYAYDLIMQQFSHIGLVASRDMEGCENLCNCPFWTTMNLPCAHILGARSCRDLALFSENLVAPRWTRDYVFRVKNVTPATPPSECRVSEIAAELTSLAAQVGVPKILQALKDIWMRDFDLNALVDVCSHQANLNGDDARSESRDDSPDRNWRKDTELLASCCDTLDHSRL